MAKDLLDGYWMHSQEIIVIAKILHDLIFCKFIHLQNHAEISVLQLSFSWNYEDSVARMRFSTVANTKNTEKSSRLWYNNIECWREYWWEVARTNKSDPLEYLGDEE